jgi:hypothetical protein
MTPSTPIWRLVLPFLLVGIGMAFIWSPLAATATRNLPADVAGAGSGVYNATRQVGGVLGSAGMAAFMTSQISVAIPAAQDPGVGEGSITRLPGFLHEPFSAALSQSLLLPAFVALLGVIAAIFLRGSGDGPVSSVGANPAPVARVLDAHHEPDYFPDDDDYVEYAVDWDTEDQEFDEWDPPRRDRDEPILAPQRIAADDGVTEPLAIHVEHPLHAPADAWHGGPIETWHSLMADESRVDAESEPEPDTEPDPDTDPELSLAAEALRAPVAVPVADGDAPWRSILDELLDDSDRAPARTQEPIIHAHNGFHGLHGSQDHAQDGIRRGGRHARAEGADGDAGIYGRHSMPFHD